MVAFRDFKHIAEAVVSNKYYKSGKYIPDIISAIENGGPLYVTDSDKNKVKVFFPDNAKEKAIDIIKSHDGEGKAPFAVGRSEDGEDNVTFQIDKIEKKFTKDDVVSVSVNVGNVTEGVLGLAIAGKFSNTSAKLDSSQVIDLGKKFIAKGDNTISLDVVDRTQDSLQLKITVPSGDTKALKTLFENDGDGIKTAKMLGLSDDAGKKLDKLIEKCTNYANTGEAPKNAVTRIQEYYTDEVKQTIEVTSDGAEAENQNLTKVDLKLEVKGKETEVLSLLSLKAGSGRSQIGQASGKPFENLRLFWKQNFAYDLPSSYKSEWDKLYKEVADEKGKVPVTNEITKMILNGPIKKTYDWAAEKIEGHLRGDRTEGEVDFLEHLQKGLLYHSGKNVDKENRAATLTVGDENVVVAIIDFGASNDFVELRFAQPFYNLMTFFNLESTGVKTATGDNGMYIQILVKPNKELISRDDCPAEVKSIANSLGESKVLCQYRSYIQGGTTIRNIVEVDKGAKVLGALSNEQFKIAKAIKAGDTVKSATGNDMVAGVDGKATVVPAKKPATNDPNAKVEEALMKPSVEFGPTFDIVDDLHIYMRNNKDMYRSQYFPMLCNMQKAIQANEKISVKKLMMPTIRACGDAYNREYQLANTMEDLMTLEQARELAKKIYDEEMPLIRKGAYK